MLLRHDESELIQLLETLPAALRVAFASLCAERLMPLYVKFADQSGRGDPRAIGVIADRLWEDIDGKTMSANELRERLVTVMGLIPREDVEPWTALQAEAEDAVTALAYALRSRESGASQEAAWAARRAYEALDHYVIARDGIDTNRPGGEERVLRDPLVQAEFLRQREDLKDLAKASAANDMRQQLIELRARAKTDGRHFLGSDGAMGSVAGRP